MSKLRKIPLLLLNWYRRPGISLLPSLSRDLTTVWLQCFDADQQDFYDSAQSTSLRQVRIRTGPGELEELYRELSRSFEAGRTIYRVFRW